MSFFYDEKDVKDIGYGFIVGDMINTQMGLSSAMVMDPSTKSQVSVMANYFSVLALFVESVIVLNLAERACD